MDDLRTTPHDIEPILDEQGAVACFNPGLAAEVRAGMADHDEIEAMALIFRAASEPLRAKILCALLEAEELCVCDLSVAVGATQSAVSRQLRFLREHGVVRPRKAAQLHFYSLRDECIRDLILRALEHVRHVSSEDEAKALKEIASHVQA